MKKFSLLVTLLTAIFTSLGIFANPKSEPSIDELLDQLGEQGCADLLAELEGRAVPKEKVQRGRLDKIIRWADHNPKKSIATIAAACALVAPLPFLFIGALAAGICSFTGLCASSFVMAGKVAVSSGTIALGSLYTFRKKLRSYLYS